MAAGEDRAVAPGATLEDILRELELIEGWTMLQIVQAEDPIEVWLRLRKSLEGVPMPDWSGRGLPVTIYVTQMKT